MLTAKFRITTDATSFFNCLTNVFNVFINSPNPSKSALRPLTTVIPILAMEPNVLNIAKIPPAPAIANNQLILKSSNTSMILLKMLVIIVLNAT